MALFGALSIASQALLSQQIGVKTTNRNINNVYTDGYSREVPILSDSPAAGVKVEDIRRVFNKAYFKRLLSNSGEYQNLETYRNVLEQVESVFNDQMGSGLSEALNDFFNSMHDIAVKPDDLAARANFLSVTKTLVGRIRDSYSSLEEIKTTTEGQLRDTINELNRLSDKLRDINKSMLLYKDTPDRLNQYLDERDRTLKEISKLIDVKVVYLPDERVRVYTAKGVPLVLETKSFNVSYENSKISVNGIDITKELQKGKISGLAKGIEQVENYMEKLNLLVSTFAEKINLQHEAGYDLYGNTGIKLFKSDNGNPIDASNITLAFDDPKKVAAASDSNYLSSDNTNIKALIDLGNQKYSELSNLSFSEYYGTEIVSSIGSDVKEVKDLVKSSKFRLDAIEEKVKEFSSVNIDEELINLTKYQRAYQAAARIVTVTDELLQTILSMKR
ncbi:flagellar hook-associated protein 1 FlgK [Balnearium lithotrophicum]|uniref:Flagellar hook-associated protein 1 n=1 Tax=Balnearium lithotrophicum TaxID=223788 RepID=A0A521EG14_9BACT|nr:flagellar hook-associated protein FlgK [Balnearium lithotrophicum]SMO82863.1 flagellar hook-associated protein 1 FlgK [Balnearium lithotrophicum]